MYSPSVAFDGRNYLVVWDYLQSYYFYGLSRVRAVRVTPEGRVVDASPINISQQGSASAVAFGETDYLVVWSSYAFPGGSKISMTRVDPSGTVLDRGGVVLGRTYGGDIAVSSNGSNYLVVWTGDDGQIRGARVTGDGVILDPGGFAITSGATSPTGTTVSSDGKDYLVAWGDSRFGCCSIFGTRVTEGGAVLDTNGFAIATHGRKQEEPAIAFNGVNYLVGWTDHRSVVSDIYGARVTPAGRVLDPRGILLSTAPPLRPCRVPRVVGLSLKRARERLHAARCSVGGVRRTRSKRPGRVLRQSQRPGRVRWHGYPVWLVVGRR
jgi:hypothetical protein